MVTAFELKEKLELEVLAGDLGLSKNITGCYIGDRLSSVMRSAKSGDVWLTVVGHINTVAVCSFSGISCVILVEGVKLEDSAKKIADQKGITILGSRKTSYDLAIEISKILVNI